jgi:hypothetical protein
MVASPPVEENGHGCEGKNESLAAIARRLTPDFTEQLIEPFTQLRSEVDR